MPLEPAETLQALRRRLSYRQIAKLTGLSLRTLWLIHSDPNFNPTLRTLKRLESAQNSTPVRSL